MANQVIRMHIPKKDGTSEVARDLVREIRRGYRNVDKDVKDMVADLWERQGTLQGNQTRQQMLEIERAFQRYAPPTLAVYDAYVDSRLSADSVSTKTFRTPFAAIQYVADTLGRQFITLGWLRGPTDAAANIAVEAGSYSGTNSGLTVSLEVIGPDGTLGTGAYSLNSNNPPTWDVTECTDSGKFQYLKLRGMKLYQGGAGANFMTAASAKVWADGCNFDGQGGSFKAIQPGFYFRSSFQAMDWPNVNAPTFLFNCVLNNTLSTMTRTIYAFSCHFNFTAGSTVTCTPPRFYASECVFSANGDTWGGQSSAIGGVNVTFNFTGTTDRIHISSVGELTGVSQGPAIILASFGWSECILEGQFWAITLGASTANSSIAKVSAYVEQNFDISGPAFVALAGGGSSGTPANFLRGVNISGAITLWGNYNSGTALSFVGVTSSVVTVSMKGTGTPSAGKGYAIDAACANNVFIIEDSTLFPTASTNLSATSLVITHLGTPPTGPAGGDLSGTYPNPSVVDDSHLHTAATVTGPFPPSGAASGSLAGTYPSPTFAGRDSSVDKLNQDILPAALLPGEGVNTFPVPAPGSAPTGPAGGSLTGTYPNPTFGGRNASGDKMDQDFLAWLANAVEGVSNIPALVPPETSADLDARRKDLVPADLVGPTPGVNVIPAAASGGAPTGPAGGSLTGTYPNPTFVGRDSSVDKLNQDMLPTWVGGVEGVVTTPTPALPETSADIDARRKDLVPADLVGPTPGITIYPATTSDKDMLPSWVGELASGVAAIPTPVLPETAADLDARRKDLIPADLVGPTPGVNVIPAATGGGGAPTGPAGGSLAGTYPNPTFAGRDTSVDKLNQDLLPAGLLAPAAGLSRRGNISSPGPYGGSTTTAFFTVDEQGRIDQISNTAIILPETATDLDLRRKDLVPAAFLPGEGVTYFPVPALTGAITRGQVVALVQGVFVP